VDEHAEFGVPIPFVRSTWALRSAALQQGKAAVSIAIILSTRLMVFIRFLPSYLPYPSSAPPLTGRMHPVMNGALSDSGKQRDPR
jgi:hypothetical protein